MDPADTRGAHPKPGTTADPRQQWPEGSADQAEALQRLLVIDDRQWHALKGQPSRRAAEQLAGALVQLLGADTPTASRSSEARQRAIALTASALAWLEGAQGSGLPGPRPLSRPRRTASWSRLPRALQRTSSKQWWIR